MFQLFKLGQQFAEIEGLLDFRNSNSIANTFIDANIQHTKGRMLIILIGTYDSDTYENDLVNSKFNF